MQTNTSHAQVAKMEAFFSKLRIWGYSQISTSTIFPDKTPDLNSYDITSIQTSLFFTCEIKNEKFKNEVIFVVFSEVRGIKKGKLAGLLYLLPISCQNYIRRMIIIFCFISGLYLIIWLNILVDDCHFFCISYEQSLFSMPNCFLKRALIQPYIQHTNYSL